MNPYFYLSPWERASGLCRNPTFPIAAALTPTLSQREREEYMP